MKASKENIAPYFFKAWKLLGLVMLFMLMTQLSYAQNTKGAEVSGGSRTKRESKFRLPTKKKKQKSTNASYRRVQGRGVSQANSARKMPSTKPRKIYPQSGRSVNYSSKRDTQKAWKGDITGRRIRAPRAGEKTRNVYPQYGRYVNNPSRKSRNTKPNVTSNRSTVSRLNRLQRSHAKSSSGGRKQVVIPRSASHSFIARKSINVYANFPRPKPKKEKAHIKDITGRTLRTKNFETQRPGISAPTFTPYAGRKRAGDKAYKGQAAGSHQSASRRYERAWKGNISGNKIRGRNYSSKPRIEGKPIFPKMNLSPYGKDRRYRGAMPTSGYRSATQPGETRTGKRPLPPRAPGIGANRIGKFQGNIKGSRSQKGGGSVSGRSWNNRQSALPVRTPGPKAARAANYQGSIKRLGQSAPGFANQGEGFSGYIKTRRPAKGGGSISGRVWNNGGKSINGKAPTQGARAATFQGNIKTQRPAKGGGSISGRVWNNSGKPINGKAPIQGARAATFQGNIKTQRPLKGGGSISGRVWNNKQKPLPPRVPPPAAQRAGTYQGSIRRFEQSPTFMDQGEEFTGFIKLRKFRKNYVQNPNAAEKSIKKKYPDKSTYAVGGLQVRVKERDYVQNKNSAEKSILKKKPTQSTYQTGDLQVKVKERDYVQNKNAAKESLLKKKPTQNTYRVGDLQVKIKERNYIQNKNSAKESLLKKQPTKSTYLVDGLQVKVKQQDYGKKPHAAEGSMPGIKPSKSSVKASEYARGVKKTWDYIHNPSSADDALKVREPGKAFGRATDYQGNIKMQKFHLFEKNRHLHPDATFVKTNKNNVDGERDLLTNVKLWWAKLFKKQDTQPDNLKEKGKKPRYDKREDGLWYD